MSSRKHKPVQSSSGKESTGGKGTLGEQLGDLRQRMDHLEKEMLDLKGVDDSGRVIDRKHELEQLTRSNCDRMLQLADARGVELRDKMDQAEEWVEKVEKSADAIEQRLKKQGRSRTSGDVQNTQRAKECDRGG